MTVRNFIPVSLFFILNSVTPLAREEQAQSREVPIKEVLYIYRLSQITVFVVIGFILFGLIYFLIRYRNFKKKEKTARMDASEFTHEEIKAIYGEDLPEEMLSPDKLSREALKSIAEKELAREGKKPGDVKYFDGPLDWDDVDEKFHPKPKIIRSEFSKDEVSPKKQKPTTKDNKDKQSNNS